MAIQGSYGILNRSEYERSGSERRRRDLTISAYYLSLSGCPCFVYMSTSGRMIQGYTEGEIVPCSTCPTETYDAAVVPLYKTLLRSRRVHPCFPSEHGVARSVLRCAHPMPRGGERAWTISGLDGGKCLADGEYRYPDGPAHVLAMLQRWDVHT